MQEGSFHVEVHYEHGAFWAVVSELPGCFATGETVDELIEALCEAVSLFVTPEDEEPESIRLRIDRLEVRAESVRELRPARLDVDDQPLPIPPLSRSAHREWGPFRFRRR